VDSDCGREWERDKGIEADNCVFTIGCIHMSITKVRSSGEDKNHINTGIMVADDRI
jgi:hypothetical protein